MIVIRLRVSFFNIQFPNLILINLVIYIRLRGRVYPVFPVLISCVFLVSCDRSQCEPPTTTSTSTTTTTTPRPVRIEPEFDEAQLGSRQGPGLSRGDEGIRGDPGRMGRTGDSGVPGRDINAYLLSFLLTFISLWII